MRALWCFLVLLLACGESVSLGREDAAVVLRPDPQVPDPPLPPVIPPCPEGWRELIDTPGVPRCEPWPETGERTDCAVGDAHLPGTAGCAPLGDECPADGWPAGLPSDRAIVYVDDDAAPGGDGSSRDRAHRSIRTAMSSAPAGAIVAVAAGSYDEVVAVREGRTLWGACAASTRLSSSSTDERMALLALAERSAGARNLSVIVSARPGVVVAAPEVSLEGVAVTGARLVGISVSSGSLAARRISVTDTTSDAAGMFGNGISVGPGSSLTLEEAALLRNRNSALSVTGGTATARSIVASDTRPLELDQRFGHGVSALSGASVTIEEAVLERNHADAVLAADAGTVLVVRRSVLRGTLAQASDGTFGRGVEVITGARIELARTWIQGNRTGGVFAFGAGSEIAATDVVIEDTLAQDSDQRLGIGAHVGEGAALTLERAHIEDSVTLGVLATGASATLEATDLRVLGVSAQVSDQRFGRGVHLRMGARGSLTRVAIEDARECGIGAIDSGTVLQGEHVRVARIEPGMGDAWGVGIAAEAGARASLDIVRVESVHLFGARAHAGAALVLTDLGVFAVAQSACASSACPRSTAAFGIAAQDGAVTVTRVLVQGVGGEPGCGAMVSGTGTIDLHDGRVEAASVAGCIDRGGYDASRITGTVDRVGVGADVRLGPLELPGALPLY